MGAPPFGVLHEFFGEASARESNALAREVELIVGMHPDEVTEPIVDAALRAGAPFAVVPCCVFSRQFPWRTLGSTRVTTHEQLCRYLVAKDPQRIRLGTLPFAGKNTVVFSLGARAVRGRSRTGAEEAAACGVCEVEGAT